MENILFSDEVFTCECGFKGNFLQIEKHFKNTWTFVNTELVSGVNKHGHTRARN